jgi:hypothetical protein
LRVNDQRHGKDGRGSNVEGICQKQSTGPKLRIYCLSKCDPPPLRFGFAHPPIARFTPLEPWRSVGLESRRAPEGVDKAAGVNET